MKTVVVGLSGRGDADDDMLQEFDIKNLACLHNASGKVFVFWAGFE